MSAPSGRRDTVAGTSARHRARRKDTRRLLEAIEAAGGTAEQSPGQGGHWKVYLDGRYIGGLCCTPSDHRSMQNDIARLRRNGLRITSKGRYAG